MRQYRLNRLLFDAENPNGIDLSAFNERVRAAKQIIMRTERGNWFV